MSARRLAWLLFGVVFVAVFPNHAKGQTNERIYENLDFRFVTPGARAVGLGKTFVGLADDATAAYSNPAGLSNLLAKEASIEFQMTDLRHERLTSMIPGGPVEKRMFGDSVWGPSFLSYVWPLRRWTVSFFLNTVQDYRESFEFQGRPIAALEASEDGAFGAISVRNQQYGAGLSYVINPVVSVGGSLVASSLSLASEGRSGTRLNPRNGTNTIGNDTRISGMGGALVKPARGLSLGASYFGGANFNLTTRLFGSFLHGSSPAELHDVVRMGHVVPIKYVVPPRMGLGFSGRLSDGVTILFDADRIWYSRQISENFVIVDFQAEAFGLTRENFSVRDVWELHCGAEFRIYRPSLTLAFRVGGFTDPDHRVRFRQTGPDAVATTLLDFRFNSVADETDLGVTVGFGVMHRNRLQFDVAGSFSPDARELVMSMVLRP
jgi:long-chain fatty acid transport protein